VTEPPGEFLTPAELRALTECAYVEPQCAKLEEIGVPYKRKSKGILVSRIHVRAWLLGEVLCMSAGVDLSKVR